MLVRTMEWWWQIRMRQRTIQHWQAFEPLTLDQLQFNPTSTRSGQDSRDLVEAIMTLRIQSCSHSQKLQVLGEPVNESLLSVMQWENFASAAVVQDTAGESSISRSSPLSCHRFPIVMVLRQSQSSSSPLFSHSRCQASHLNTLSLTPSPIQIILFPIPPQPKPNFLLSLSPRSLMPPLSPPTRC